jgi:alpha-glucan phosphorylase-like protein
MSAEFALDDRLPIYSGGLGVLAGDIVRQANDLNLPFVAVGLLYKAGYFKQSITLAGEQKEYYPILESSDAPIELVVNTEGERILVRVPIQDREVTIQIWEYCQGDVSVYLLDTDVPENSPTDRLITQRLYDTRTDVRFLQEIILGIGGVRALMELHIHPSIYHLNESHSALAILEIAHHYMDEYGMSFDQAYEYGRQKIVFTNHTLVAAGNECFPATVVTEQLSAYTKHISLAMDDVLKKGQLAADPTQFSLTVLALNMASRINAVSKLHSVRAKLIWPDKDMIAITNGVNLPHWVNPDLKAQAPQFDSTAINALPPHELWQLHLMAKKRLVDEVKFQTGHVLNPDALIMTWARRFADYKQPELLFSDIEKLRAIVNNADKPVQLIMAGKAHPGDVIGHSHIHNIIKIIKDQKLSANIVFIQNYTISLASVLVSGVDLWINTPRRGEEASGTSGMKAGANGVLQCSVSDGWVDEVDLEGIGWILPEAQTALALYKMLETDIVPLYYNRNADKIPVEWVNRMKLTIGLIWGNFSAERMLSEYIDIMYRPALEAESMGKHEHNWRRNYRTRPI